MNNLLNDLKFAIRNLSKSPGFVAVAIITLALGIGLNTAIFSVVNMLLFRPLPYDNADRIVAVFRTDFETARTLRWSYPHFEDYRDELTSFEHFVAWANTDISVGRGDSTQMRRGILVSGDYFEALGAQPTLGRLFNPTDDQTIRGHPVAVLGYDFWQRKLEGDPAIIGQTLALNGHDFTVIGVAEEGFAGVRTVALPDLWVTMMMEPIIRPATPALERRGTMWMDAFGVRKPGVSLEQANAELALVATQLREADPDANDNEHAAAYPLIGIEQDPNDRSEAYALVALIMTMVGLVLLIACANIANLLLARSTTRRKEIGIRLALGSTRGRIVRQLLIESMLIAITGGIVGTLVAVWSMNGLKYILPELPMSATISPNFGLDRNLLLFAFTISTLTGVVFGLVPALQAARTDLIPALKDDGGGSSRYRKSRLRNSLVVGQVAISLVLLIASGLFVRSLVQAGSIDPGFAHEHTLAFKLDLARQQYDEDSGRVFCDQLLARVRDLPSVESACLDHSVPLGWGTTVVSYYVEGDTATFADGTSAYRHIRSNIVSPDDFQTLDIPLLMGRDFNETDILDGPGVVIVNSTFAEMHWPDESPLGKRISIHSVEGPFLEIVGVVKTVIYDSPGESPTPVIHRALSQTWNPILTLLVRSSGDPLSVMTPVRDIMRDLDPNFSPSDTRTLTKLIKFALVPAKLGAGIFSLFGLIALLLASIGLYGVMSYMVSQRTHEIGIRMAIGADKSDVLRLIMKQGLTLTIIGLGIGLVVALGFTRVLASLLYDVSPSDPLTFVAITLLLATVATLATLIPARRAMSVDPMVALRYE
ncbi:MAG: ABC transporter permease [Planctomycetes bacterium]|nr:ABC transporter permease [Planctomycetota bacterium]